MTDPHIDIDAVDSPDSNFFNNGGSVEETATDSEAEFGFSPNLSQFASSFFNLLERFRGPAGFGAGGGFDPLPYESRKHFRTSQREFLLGWRTLIDDSIRRLDERDTRDNVRQAGEPVANNGRSAGIKVEVEEIED